MIATTWNLLAESAGWLLVGLVFAGVLEALLSRSRLLGLLRGEGARSVGWATLLGVPLPLCSCSVLPTALSLRRGGAGRGPTLAFLVATPETSVTSVALTWGLLGPWFALLRPLAAALSAFAAGMAGAWWGGPARSVASEPAAAACCAAADGCGAGAADADEPRASLAQRLRRGFAFAFGDLLDDVFVWVLVGVVAAAAVVTWLPPSALTDVPGGTLGAMFAMVLVGVPLYICAEASTPLAAALVAQGLSPGAALVLLLVGPATNVGSLGVLAREFGARTVAIYLTAVIAVAVGVGWLVDAVLGITPQLDELVFHEHGPGVLGHGAAALFLVLGAVALWRHRRGGSGGAGASGSEPAVA